VGLVKVGSQLASAEGPRAVQELSRAVPGIFLDLKFHDIPNTVAGAVAAVAELPGIRMLTVHTTGGLEMMRAARRALRGKKNRPKLLGVTLLTSLDAEELKRVGIKGGARSRALQLAKLAKKAGMDGVVASAHEARAIRRGCGKKFLIVVPGVRPVESPVGKAAKRKKKSKDDQARVATPAEAIRAGADYIVVGRPITHAADPRVAAEAIVEEMSKVLRRR